LRDYDKEPIIIKDYGAIFSMTLFFTIFGIAGSYAIATWIEEDLEQLSTTIRVIGAIYGIFYISYMLFILIPKNFNKTPSFFKFSNENIYYRKLSHAHKKEKILNEINADTRYIQKVYFCVIPELCERFGRKHYLTSWQMFRKSAIAIPLIKLYSFLYYWLTFLLFVLPFKIHKLKKDGEPLYLLKKNIVIEFTNRNYFLITIYCEKELNELFIYFRDKDIPIVDKTLFLAHVQVDTPTFFDKDERWCDDFENREVKKQGMIKRLLGMIGNAKNR
jgi:hypothetical protein